MLALMVMFAMKMPKMTARRVMMVATVDILMMGKGDGAGGDLSGQNLVVVQLLASNNVQTTVKIR